MFDPAAHEDVRASIGHWVEAIQRAAGGDCPRFLVAGRVDRGKPRIPDSEFQSLLATYRFEGYVATSAKTGEAVDRLIQLLQSRIRWESLPLTHSPTIWRELKSFVTARRAENEFLTRCADLKIAFRLAYPRITLSDRAFDTVIAHLQTQGLVWRLSFGDLIMLRPEVLNDYASATVLAARGHPKGLGCVAERDVLDARIDLTAVTRIPDPRDERSLLHAVVERFLEREIALREGEHLVFPSKLNLPEPASTRERSVDTVYHFHGPVEEVYATLIVRLVYGRAFEIENVWRNSARFRDSVGNGCHVSVEPQVGAPHRLGIHFEPQVSLESRVLFSRFIHDHLHRKAVPDSVERQRVFRCGGCGQDASNARAVAARLRAGETTIFCQFCGAQVAVMDDLEQRFTAPETLQQVRSLEQVGERARNREVGVTTANAKHDIEEYDVFLAYHSADETDVEAVAENLLRRGINPWFAKWCVLPGRQFQREIEKVLCSIGSVAVFLGPSGIGPWQKLEINLAIQSFVNRQIPVIPVSLSGSDQMTKFPPLIQTFQLVSFKHGPADEVALDELQSGITGIHPKRRRSPV